MLAPESCFSKTGGEGWIGLRVGGEGGIFRRKSTTNESSWYGSPCRYPLPRDSTALQRAAACTRSRCAARLASSGGSTHLTPAFSPAKSCSGLRRGNWRTWSQYSWQSRSRTSPKSSLRVSGHSCCYRPAGQSAVLDMTPKSAVKWSSLWACLPLSLSHGEGKACKVITSPQKRQKQSPNRSWREKQVSSHVPKRTWKLTWDLHGHGFPSPTHVWHIWTPKRREEAQPTVAWMFPTVNCPPVSASHLV